MIYKGDNHNEQFFEVAMLPLISIPLFWAVFSAESTLLGKIVAGLLGLILLILPVRSFIYNRYEVLFEEDRIRIRYTSGSVKEKRFSYAELESIKFTSTPRGWNHVTFRFAKRKGMKRKYIVELEKKESVIPLILHCKTQNIKTKYEALPVHGDLFNYIKRELYKSKRNALQDKASETAGAPQR